MDAEALLAGLEPIGWKLGTDRVERLTTALGRPQDRFTSIHVVGTNGKSSATRMTAALLEAHGVSTGAHTSPHLSRWAERVQIGGRTIGPRAFERAVSAAAAAAARIETRLEEGERVTQFELSAASALVALASAGVDVGVIEAGLGGRLDATNVLPSTVTALTSIGLDHTAWLGDTVEEIAVEKLAVLRPGSTLVIGSGLTRAVEAIARAHAESIGARVLEADLELAAEVAPPGFAPYLVENLAVSLVCAAAIVGPLDRLRCRQAIERLALPGRMELIATDPPVYLDAAHNPDGAAALARALADLDGDRPVIACVAVLADKDAKGIAAALAPQLAACICTQVSAPTWQRSIGGRGTRIRSIGRDFQRRGGCPG